MQIAQKVEWVKRGLQDREMDYHPLLVMDVLPVDSSGQIEVFFKDMRGGRRRAWRLNADHPDFVGEIIRLARRWKNGEEHPYGKPSPGELFAGGMNLGHDTTAVRRHGEYKITVSVENVGGGIDVNYAVEKVTNG